MATESTFKLGETALRQLAETVQKVRDRYPNEVPQPRGQRLVPPIWQAFKPTSGPSGGIYTGNIVLWDGTTETAIATGVKGVLAFGTTATSSNRYPARLVGENSGVALYLFWRTPDGMTDTQDIVTNVTCSAGSLVVTKKTMTIEDGLVMSIV